MFHQECDLSRQRSLDMRTEVGRNRFETRLRSARREEAKAGAFYAEIAPRRTLIARGATFAMALFR
jgi:hypothetical protein